MKVSIPALIATGGAPLAALVYCLFQSYPAVAVCGSIAVESAFCVVALQRLGESWISPAGWALAAVGLLYGAGAFAWNSLFQTEISGSGLAVISVGIVGFILLFTLGYIRGHKLRPVKRHGIVLSPRARERPSTIDVAFWNLAALALLAVLIHLYGGLSALTETYEETRLKLYTGAGLYWGVLATLIGAACATNWIRASRAKSGQLLAAVGVLIASASAILVSRSVLFYILGVIFVASYQREKRNNKARFVLVATVLCSLYILIAAGRTMTQGSDAEIDFGDKAQVASTLLLGQFDHFDTLVQLESEKSRWSLQWGNTILLPILLKPIPRSVWPMKPVGSSGWFMNQFYPGWSDGEISFNRAAGLIGEMRINFGLPGVLIGGWLFGVGCAVARNRILASMSSVALACGAWLTVSTPFLIRNDVSSNVPWLLSFLAGIALSKAPREALQALAQRSRFPQHGT